MHGNEIYSLNQNKAQALRMLKTKLPGKYVAVRLINWVGNLAALHKSKLHELFKLHVTNILISVKTTTLP